MMNKLAGSLVGTMGLAFAAFSGGALALTECNTPPPSPPLSGAVAGGVVVNAGDFCILGGANVSGGVQVNSGGVLIACASTINGGIVANGAANLIIGAGADEEVPPVSFICPGNVINGAINISNTGAGVLAPAPSISIERDAVSGGVHLTGNAGMITVSTNMIAGGLFCANNAFDLDDEGTPSVITGPVRCKFGE
jgi:hypothetical protein